MGVREQGKQNAGKCIGSLKGREGQNIRTCNAAAPANVRSGGKGSERSSTLY